eukprot:3280039-Prymnesium_polylepis.1
MFSVHRRVPPRAVYSRRKVHIASIVGRFQERTERSVLTQPCARRCLPSAMLAIMWAAGATHTPCRA